MAGNTWCDLTASVADPNIKGVMPGLAPGIHVFTSGNEKTWMTGINPAKELPAAI
jgi:hypothetical protein